MMSQVGKYTHSYPSSSGSHARLSTFDIVNSISEKKVTVNQCTYTCIPFSQEKQRSIDDFKPVSGTRIILSVVPSPASNGIISSFLSETMVVDTLVMGRMVHFNTKETESSKFSCYCNYREFLNLISGRKRKIVKFLLIIWPQNNNRSVMTAVFPCILERLELFKGFTEVFFLVPETEEKEARITIKKLVDRVGGNLDKESGTGRQVLTDHPANVYHSDETVKLLRLLVLNLARHGFRFNELVRFKKYPAVKSFLEILPHVNLSLFTKDLGRITASLVRDGLLKINRSYICLTPSGKIFSYYWLPLEKLPDFKQFCEPFKDRVLSEADMAVMVDKFRKTFMADSVKKQLIKLGSLDFIAEKIELMITILLADGVICANKKGIEQYHDKKPTVNKKFTLYLPHVPITKKTDITHDRCQKNMLPAIITAIRTEMKGTRFSGEIYPVLLSTVTSKSKMEIRSTLSLLRKFYACPEQQLERVFDITGMTLETAVELHRTTYLGKWDSGYSRAKLSIIPVYSYGQFKKKIISGISNHGLAGNIEQRCRDCLFFNKNLSLCVAIKTLVDFHPGLDTCPAVIAGRANHVPPGAIACPSFKIKSGKYKELPVYRDLMTGKLVKKCPNCGGNVVKKEMGGKLTCKTCGMIYRRNKSGYFAVKHDLGAAIRKTLLDCFQVDVRLIPHLREELPLVIRRGDKVRIRGRKNTRRLEITSPSGNKRVKSIESIYNGKVKVTCINRQDLAPYLSSKGITARFTCTRHGTLPWISYREALGIKEIREMMLVKGFADLLLSIALVPFWSCYFLSDSSDSSRILDPVKIRDEMIVTTSNSLVSAAKARSRAKETTHYLRQAEGLLFKGLNSFLKKFMYQHSGDIETVNPWLGSYKDRVINDPTTWFFARGFTIRAAAMNAVNRFATKKLREIAAAEGMGYQTVIKGPHVCRDDPGKAGHLDELEVMRLFTRVKVAEWIRSGNISRNKHFDGVYSANSVKHFYPHDYGLGKIWWLTGKEVLDAKFWRFGNRNKLLRAPLTVTHRYHARWLTGFAVELHRLKKRDGMLSWKQVLRSKENQPRPYLCLPRLPADSDYPGPREMLVDALALVSKHYSAPLKYLGRQSPLENEITYLEWLMNKLKVNEWKVQE